MLLVPICVRITRLVTTSRFLREVLRQTHVDFIDLDNLKHNKRASGRPQDLADLESLEP